MNEKQDLLGVKERLAVVRKEVRAAKRAYRGIPDPPDTGLDLDRIRAIEVAEPQRKDRPRTLPLSEIKLAQQVFQHRLADCDQVDSLHHIKRLKDDINGFIKGVGTEMASLTVLAVGDQFYLVDGHHRYQAYLQSNHQKKVPVKYFPDGVMAARAYSLKVNMKGSLALNVPSRSEAAWRQVIEGILSKAEIAERTGRSTSLIGKMRAMLNANPDLAELTWTRALGGKRASDDYDAIAAEADEVTRLTARMIKNMGAKFPYGARVFAKVLEQIDADLPVRLMREWAQDAGLAKAMGELSKSRLDI